LEGPFLAEEENVFRRVVGFIGDGMLNLAFIFGVRVAFK
jgi:hypothetical protein